ncbi:MAG: methylisocitrate lyase [Rhodospirillales bacterium CG15_BIG_FIL_POST_REV_8_21_14_020_66_15]|nr:MAG: methylisocitrate lyase [Rhodospirillales bacterium CG15_BIG_FIL_POST_REV_8_21_14_020_66_15]
MTWLEGNGREKRPTGERLRDLLDRGEILRVPGAHNAFAGMIAKQAGFETLYISGGAVTASLGLPDLGIMTLEELCGVVRSVSRTTDLPLIVDGDTGYGGVLNAMRVVKELETAGAGAVHIEDQLLPKKCGHLNDKRLVEPEEAAAKIAAAKAASSHLIIIARTDAAGVEGLEGAIKRANLYREAGADVTFPDGLPSAEAHIEFAQKVPGIKMANMTEFGRTPFFTGRQFQDMGFNIVIWPATSMRAAARLFQDLYAHIREHDGTEGFMDRVMSRADQYDTLAYYDYEALDASVARSVVPEYGK